MLARVRADASTANSDGSDRQRANARVSTAASRSSYGSMTSRVSSTVIRLRSLMHPRLANVLGLCTALFTGVQAQRISASRRFQVPLQRAVARADEDQVTEHVVKRWARYGHDRLYVETPDGTRLGYWDVKTGQAVVQDETHRKAVETATAAFRTAPAAPVAVPAQAAPVEGPAPVLVAPTAAVPVTAPAQTVEAAAAAPPAEAAHPSLAMAATVAAPAVDERPAAPAWTGLGLNRPGQAAREQAVAHKQAAPVRTLFARVLGVHTDERAWRIGADGEEAVAARLARLGSEWKVLHAVPVGGRGSDIDHVVIGPAGVFTINTKHHPHASVWVGGNTFMVNGQRQPYVRNSRHEAQRASRLLTAACGFPVTATGLIAVMGAHEGFTVKEQPPGGDVHVMTRREVDRWLRSQDTGVLNPEQVELVREAARRSTTWVG